RRFQVQAATTIRSYHPDLVGQGAAPHRTGTVRTAVGPVIEQHQDALEATRARRAPPLGRGGRGDPATDGPAWKRIVHAHVVGAAAVASACVVVVAVVEGVAAAGHGTAGAAEDGRVADLLGARIAVVRALRREIGVADAITARAATGLVEAEARHR